MGAIQTQNYLQALWAIGLHMQSVTVVDIEQAIATRKILRTWPMRGTILATEYASKIVPGNNGVFLPTIVVEGRVLGIWKRTLGKNGVCIQLTPFTELEPAEEKAALEAAKGFSDFLGVSLSSTAIRVSNA